MKHSASVRVNNYTLTAKYPGLKDGLKIEKSSKKPVNSRKIEDYIIEIRSQSSSSCSSVQQTIIRTKISKTQKSRKRFVSGIFLQSASGRARSVPGAFALFQIINRVISFFLSKFFSIFRREMVSNRFW